MDTIHKNGVTVMSLKPEKLMKKLWNDYYELKQQLHQIQMKMDNKLLAIKTLVDENHES